MSLTLATRFDLRDIAPRERHALVFGRFDALPAGEAFELLNDHDPRPLRDQLEGRAPGRVDWHDLESGPQHWRVRIGKLPAVVLSGGADSCCSGGACCG